MSALYPRKTSRGYAVSITFNDRYGIRHRERTGYQLSSLRFGTSGDPVWPKHILNWKEQFDNRLIQGIWNMVEQPGKRISLTAALEQFLQEDGSDKAPKTKAGYRLSMKKLTDHFGDVDLHTLDEGKLFTWRAEMIARDGEQNTALYIRTLSPIFNWAVRRKFLATSPITREVKLKQPETEIVIFSDQELDKLFAWLQQNDTPEIVHLFRFLLLSGWRVGDAIALTWDRVDLSRRVIMHTLQKTKTPREYPMDQELERFMRSLPMAGSHVFAYRSLSTPDHKLRNALDNHLKYPSASRLKVHTFRKQFTYNCQRRGVRVDECAKLLGHREIKTTLRYYTYWDTDELRRALSKSRTKKYLDSDCSNVVS